MIFETISWIALAMGVLSLWIAGKYNYGWLIGVMATIPWSITAIHLKSGAVLINTLIFCAVNLRNYLVGKRKFDNKLRITPLSTGAATLCPPGRSPGVRGDQID
jgi:hypothetical protein